MRGLALSAFIATGLCTTVCSAQSIKTIALSGQQPPGAALGVHFRFLGEESIADASTLIFTATLDSPTNNRGFWIYRNGSLEKLALLGDILPAGAVPGASPNWTALFDAAINPSGQIAIQGRYNTASGDLGGLWTGSPAALAPVILDGDPAPGIAGATISSIPTQPISMDNQGRVAFYAMLRNAGSVTLANDSGLWVGRPGTVALAARENDHPFGTPATVRFDQLLPIRVPSAIGPVYPPMLAHGNLGFLGPLLTSPNSTGIFAGPPGVIAKIVRESDSDPGAEQFSQVYLSNGLNGFGMNAAGQVSFLATRSLGKIGIWVSENSALHNIVLQDQSAGPNSTFKFFGQPVMNSSGEIAFYGRVQEGQTTRETLWSWRDGQLQKIASSADNPIFAGIGGSSRDRYAINDSGQIAFYTYSTSTPQTALWGYDPASGLHPIAAIGQSLEVAPGDVRTISDLLFQTGAGTGDGRPISLNNAGEVVFELTFTDGSSGIFLSGVPEPTSGLLFIFTIFTVLRFSHRHHQATDRHKRIIS